MNTVKQLFFRLWRTALLVLGLALIAYLLYFRRLAKLLPGYSVQEISTYAHATNWHDIATNPVNAPYKCLVWLLTAIAHHNILMTRAVAAGFGVLAVVLFFAVIRPWYSFRIATLGTLLFATSAGLLHYARFGTGDILQMSVLLLLAALVWYRRQEQHRVLIGYALIALLTLLWYVPGMIWFELFALIMAWKGLRHRLQSVPILHLVGWAATFLVILSPLVLASLRNVHLLLVVSGLPPSMSAVRHIGSNLLNGVMSIGVRSNGNSLFWVGRTPLLTAAELVLGAIGVYFYVYYNRSVRTVFLVGSVMLCLVLIGLGGSVGFASLIPLLYLFIVHGLDHLLGRWLVVFPRNPIARYTGVAVICFLLFFSILYQSRSYFIAWPHTPATIQTFNLH